MDLKDFKKSSLFDKYSGWVDSIISPDYYSPDKYDEDGDLIREASFDVKGLEKEEEEILDVSISVYDKIAYGRIYEENRVDLVSGKALDPASILIQLTNDYSHNQVALLGTVYYLFVYDYPNYKPIFGNKMLKMWKYNELFTRAFLDINGIREWLDLYSSLRSITSILEIPESLRKDNVLIFLNNLIQHKFLDESYKFTPLAKRGAWKRLIAYNLNLKGDCSYAELEEHFQESNLRDNRSLDSFETKKSKNEATCDEIDTYNTIKNCFR